MNECEQAGRLGAYYDGQMSPDDRAAFERHLGGCTRCAAELASLRGLSRLLMSVCPAPMPLAAMDRLHRAVDMLPSGGILRMAKALAAVAAMILAACLLGLASSGPSAEPPGGMPVWEAQAVAQAPTETASAGSEELLASWIAQDLSWKDEP